MTLKSDLEQSAISVGLLEVKVEEQAATIGQQALMLADLNRRLAECLEGVPPPDPIPDPAPLPVPGNWPTGGTVVTPANFASKIVAAPAGSTFRFESGTYNLTAPLPLKGGNTYYGADPANRPKLVGPGPAGFPFANATVGGITLKGLDISKFGPANTTEGGSMVNKADGTANSAGVDWLIEDCNIGNTNNGIVRWGAGWTLRRTRLHDGGRYALHGGGMQGTKTIEDCEWVHIGYGTTSNNRGGSKFALTKGIVIDKLWTHDIKGSGIWWDIKNEGATIKNVTAEDCTRMGINFEVSYGPFTVTNPIMRRCGSDKKSSEGEAWPIPGGMQLSMTPNVTVTNPLVEDCRNGITVIQWQHPQLLPTGHPDKVGNMTDADRARCGNENIIINGGKITRIAEHAAGMAGNRPAGTRPTRNIHWNNVAFDAGAKFRSALHF